MVQEEVVNEGKSKVKGTVTTHDKGCNAPFSKAIKMPPAFTRCGRISLMLFNVIYY